MPATPAPITITSWCDLAPSVMLHSSVVLLGVAALALLCFTIATIRRLHLRQDAGTAPLKISRRTLFESETLQISLFEARGVTDACGDVERQSQNAIALPLSGVFSKHDAPGHHVIGTPSHAVFFAADTPTASAFPAASAIAPSPCGLARRWRPNIWMCVAVKRCGRKACCRPKP